MAGRTLKLTLQYDGTDYVGWQRQENGRSIQELLERALEPIEGAPVGVVGAGRTDAGVHALGQVASLSLISSIPVASLARALNATLPPDIRVIAAEEAATGFHARFSAVAKRYEYRIVNAPVISPFVQRYAWHIPHALDADAMRGAARALVGRHDFAAFQAAGSDAHSTERTIHEIAWADGSGPDAPLRIRISGDGFLRHMVRTIVGTLVEVGAGRQRPGWVDEVLAARQRAAAGPTAPAKGLFLVSVEYPARRG